MTLNRLILIETAKNIVISINNNAFVHGLTGSTEPGNTEPSIDINFLNCHFDNNR